MSSVGARALPARLSMSIDRIARSVPSWSLPYCRVRTATRSVQGFSAGDTGDGAHASPTQAVRHRAIRSWGDRVPSHGGTYVCPVIPRQ